MWTAHFIAASGAPFRCTEDELNRGTSHPFTMLEYIAYCTEHGSILISLEQE